MEHSFDIEMENVLYMTVLCSTNLVKIQWIWHCLWWIPL